MSYDEIEGRLSLWAADQPDIRAVIVVGSRARGDEDRWSDLDVLVFTTDRQRYADDPGWLRTFGNVWLTYREETARGDAEWYALYDGGLKFDAVLLPVEDPTLSLDALLAQYPYQGVFGRGIKVLFDRLGSPRSIARKPFSPPAPPTSAEFDNTVSGFLMSAVTVAKFIDRGDFYRAQRWFANDLHVHLLRLIEWHAHGIDTWYSGRFIERWAGERARRLLEQTFAHSDRADLQRALLIMLVGFRVLGEETAARFGFEYPTETHQKVDDLVITILESE
jgi:aminoglycoside 6-adenylyltransferase